MATRLPISAGELNQRVQLQRRSGAQDAAGQPVNDWSTVATVWARVSHLSGADMVKASADVSIVSTSVVIRLRSDVDESMRLLYRGSVYRITAVLPDERLRQFMELLVEVVR